MWWRRADPLDWEVVNGLITFVMKIDAKLDVVLRLLGTDDGEEEADA